MINRRHIRIKVMQSVYAILQSNSDNLNKEEKFLLASIDKMYDLYALSLSLLIDVQEMAFNHLEITKKKYLASSEDKDPNTKFTNNQLIAILKESAVDSLIRVTAYASGSDAAELTTAITDTIPES